MQLLPCLLSASLLLQSPEQVSPSVPKGKVMEGFGVTFLALGGAQLLTALGLGIVARMKGPPVLTFGQDVDTGPDPTLNRPAIALAITGTLSVAVGIPLYIIGRQRKARYNQSVAFMPLTHGGGAIVRFRF